MSSRDGPPPFPRGRNPLDRTYSATSGSSANPPSRSSSAYEPDPRGTSFPATREVPSAGFASYAPESLPPPLPPPPPLQQQQQHAYPFAPDPSSGRGVIQTRPQGHQVSHLPPGGIPVSSIPAYNLARTGASTGYGSVGQGYQQLVQPGYGGWESATRPGQDVQFEDADSPSPQDPIEYRLESTRSRGQGPDSGRGANRFLSQRKPSNRDEFDGPHQLLDPPSPRTIAAQEQELPHLPINLNSQEQNETLDEVNRILSKCAFDFVAKYQFPIPVEPDKKEVHVPADRDWAEWVYLLKRLATKRRIPARVLYNQQIKQLVIVLENSVDMRPNVRNLNRPLKDDRHVLQLISAAIQVAKILKDAPAMQQLDWSYMRTERRIQEQKDQSRRGLFPS